MNLLRASAKGDLAAIKKFVADGAGVNTADPGGRTPIIEAAWGGHADIVKYLLEKGADIDAVDNTGYTALMRACEEGHATVVTYLIGKKANVNARGKVRGTTPLMLAAERGHLKILELLLSKKANINAVDQYEETAVVRAYHANQIKAAKFLESKGGRGKSERSSYLHYSSRDKESTTIAKSMLPKWSAAFESENDQDTDEPAVPADEGVEE
ncbi:MAG: ankyrin repeat domain-containing protein [Chitinispirillaceae bacterium]|nr:ankyrin repeat domain-containing protein [Chitinispirillaceae bacterium]